MEQIITRIISLPGRIKGYTALDADGNYNVYINSNLSYEMQKMTYLHEMTHIARNDWSDTKTIKQAESMIM